MVRMLAGKDRASARRRKDAAHCLLVHRAPPNQPDNGRALSVDLAHILQRSTRPDRVGAAAARPA